MTSTFANQDRFSLKSQFSFLVLLLLVPSLILLFLGLRISWEDRQAIQKARQSLDVVLEFQDLLRPEIDTADFDMTEFSTALDKVLASLSEEQLEQFAKRAAELREDPSFLASVVFVRALTFDTARRSDLASVTPSAGVALPNLIKTQLLTTVVQTHHTALVLRRMAAREEFNPWDRMAVPVQAGQFKMMADTVGQVSRDHFGETGEHFSAALLEQANVYRAANRAVQGAFGSQVRLMPTAQSGAEISLAAVNPRHDAMVTALLQFWQLAVVELSGQLDEVQSATTIVILETLALGGIIVLVALVAVILVGRAFHTRTLGEIAFAYRYDALTGLPNRRSILSDLKALAEEDTGAAQDAENLTIYQIDLAKFALVNDKYGEDVGDRALKLVADALTVLCEKDGSLYRLGGNSFALLSWEDKDVWGHDMRVDRIQTRVAQACKSLKTEMALTAHVGVATAKLSSLSAQDILNDASIALTAAKQDAHGQYKLFAPEVRNSLLRRQKAESELIEALEKDEFEAWLQPQVSAGDGSIIGVEALVRWNDPNLGLRRPDQFVPLAEETGLIERIDHVVRDKAMTTLKDVNERFGLSLKLGLNMTTQLLQNENCTDILLQQTRAHNLEPSKIDLEVIESVAVDSQTSGDMAAQINALSRSGFSIELDDFGTGYAILSSLRDLSIDRIKIERSFVTDIHLKSDLQIFTNALIQLGRTLGIGVLAEGVERAEEVSWLRQHGCQYFQGYYFSRPLSPEALVDFIQERPPKTEVPLVS
ncbi:MAG: bifunctional diguanylate cyclase/phosphodiesterase [Pseudomonadota bacterium]